MPDDFDAPLFSGPTGTPSSPPSPDAPLPDSHLPVDQSQRDRAIHIDRSVLVQAPAGSGKTDLLTRRFLALLAEAPIDSPEEILAITFTRAATAEMRNRILTDLHMAATTTPATDDDQRIRLARRALARARKAGWHLLEQPDSLQIETIDSISMRIAQGQPLVARLGGRLDPVDDAGTLYLEAARHTMRHLGGDNFELSAAIDHLLNLRDNNLADCERLIAEMLARRDQWEEDFPSSGDIDWAVARSLLEKPFHDEVSRTLTRARELLQREPFFAQELLRVADYAAQNREDGALGLLAKATELPPASSLEHWQAISNFLLKKGDNPDWYAKFTKSNGLPAGKAGSEEKGWNRRGNELLEHLRTIPGLLQALRAIRALPPPRYEDDQWTTLRHLFTTLRQALGELRVLFAERNQVDFIHNSRAALTVLQDEAAGSYWSDKIRHILVDEFQDTSRRQHKLITEIIHHWSDDQSRSVFLVGDPMQSIYLFRQAEVELFHEVRDHGIHIRDSYSFALDPLTLSVNFRSHAPLTGRLNDVFGPVFAADAAEHASPVQFTESKAAHEQFETVYDPALQIHAQLLDTRDPEQKDQRRHDLRHREAETVADIIAAHSDRVEQARRDGTEYRIAVLVRNRGHLAAIAPSLRHRGIPFRAVDIEPLAERQELLDLLSLVRALLQPLDRVAWLSVLRAPWCGLTLAELHTLTGADDPAARNLPMLTLIEQNLPRLPAESQTRLRRAVDVLRRARDARPGQSQTGSFAAWIERTWHALGGHLCLDATELENAEVFFSLLDTVSPTGSEILSGEFQQQLEKLYAQPDPTVSEKHGVQLMTIHKAKGLGFEVVIVPGLERSSSSDKPPLVANLQRTSPQTGQPEFLIAPIGRKGDVTRPLYQWVRRQHDLRYAEERKRLFYVASTRARQELHLIGTASFGESGLHVPRQGSLLRTAWPALSQHFQAALDQQPEPSTEPTGAEVIAFPTPPQPGVLTEVAAETEPASPLRRLRLDADLSPEAPNVAVTGGVDHAAEAAERELHRPEGSRLARVIGSTLHLLLQRLGPQISTQNLDTALLEQQMSALLRAAALDARQAQTALRELLEMMAACQADPMARWLLADHPGAQSEASWTGWLAGSLRTLRADRIFLAGPEPLASPAPECLWIVDYKTSETTRDDPGEFMARQRQIYSPQLAAYAHVARAASSADHPVRLGLYYPRLHGTTRFDWWEG